MKTKADQLLHPALAVILRIKIFFTTIAVVAGVVKIFQNFDTAMMVDWFEIFLTVVAIYGAWLMLQTKKIGFIWSSSPISSQESYHFSVFHTWRRGWG